MKTTRKATVGIAIALSLLAGGEWWRASQRTEREASAKGAPSEAERQVPLRTALTPPQIKELPQTVRGTRAYEVRTSLGVEDLDRAVAEAGARIVSRLSCDDAIVEATDEARAKLCACCGVKSVEGCARGFKLSPALRERMSKLESGEVPRVMVMLVNAVDAATIGARIAAAGGRVTSQPNGNSRFAWVGAEMPATAVDALADLAEVSWIEPQGTLQYSNDVSVRAEELDVRRAWDDVSGLGLTGAGQVIGHADTGLDLGDITHLEPEFAGHVKAIYDHTKGGGMRDTNGHGTHTAGSIVGQGIASLGGKYRGVAHGAMLVHQSFGPESVGMPDDVNQLFAEAYQDGARIHSDSWGSSNTYYDKSAQSLDEFVWTHPDFLPVFSSGNTGHRADSEVKSPALARNVITIGAADHNGAVAVFSSRGLVDEPRIKPDVLAPGVSIVSVQSLAIADRKTCDDPAAGTRYCAKDGTSMSTPLAAGSLALMREWYLREKGKSPSAAMLTAMAVGGAAARTGTGVVSEASGWGCLAVASTLAPTNGVAVRLRDERPTIGVRARFTERFLVTNSCERLVFSLAWLDQAADPRSTELIVDYDLAVFAPDGTRHWPNGGTDEDHENLRETVVVTNAATGLWTVTVSAPETAGTGGAVALYARGAFAPDESGAKTSVWHVGNGEEIQSAVDRARNGDTVLVDAGTYAPFAATNKMLTIRGAGRDRTIIDGGGTNGAVFLDLPGDTGGLVLEGVTLENGFDDYGGGICGGTLRHSTIRNCKARYAGGGAYESVLDRCIVSNCAVVATSMPEECDAGQAAFSGGGVYRSTLYNCLVANCGILHSLQQQDASIGGGGAAYSKLANVTLVDSWMKTDWPVLHSSGAIYLCDVQNTLVSGSTYNGSHVRECWFDTKQCSYVAVVGTNAFANAAAGDYRLAADAIAAIDAGHTNYVAFYPSATDLAGTNRVMGHSVDLGCYESPYTNALPPAVDLPFLTMRPGSLVGFAIGVDDENSPNLGITMINDAWEMSAFEVGLAGADAERSELVYGTVSSNDFLEVADRIADGIRPNDVVLLSVSTHGGCTIDLTNGTRTIGSGTGFALSNKEWLMPSDVVDFAARLAAKGAKLVQVHDTCYSAGFVEMTGLPGVTSVTREESSLGYLDEGRFTDALLEAWRHPPADADLNGDGVLSLYELAVVAQRRHCGLPAIFLGNECTIIQPEELAKIAVRELPSAGEKEVVRVITDRMPPACVNQSYCFRLRAVGESNLTWSAQSELPAGLTLDADGLVRGYPQWGDVTNFLVRVESDDGRAAETNVLLCGLLATTNSRPRLVSVSVPQGAVTRSRDEGDWQVRVVVDPVPNSTNGVGYVFEVTPRGSTKEIVKDVNTNGVFTLDAAFLAAWPDVYVTCSVLSGNSVDSMLGLSEKSVAWFIRTEEPPTVQLGVVAQRYPWNGWLDIQYRTLRANAGYEVVFYANGIELGTAPSTDDEAATASFNLNEVEAFKNKAVKDVKVTAKLVAIE